MRGYGWEVVKHFKCTSHNECRKRHPFDHPSTKDFFVFSSGIKEKHLRALLLGALGCILRYDLLSGILRIYAIYSTLGKGASYAVTDNMVIVKIAENDCGAMLARLFHLLYHPSRI